MDCQMKIKKGTKFLLEVEDLNIRIKVLSTAIEQMRKYNNIDSELSIDLQWTLANSCACAPELRHSLLEQIAQRHARNGNFSEAACSQLHIAASIAEILKYKKNHTWNAEAFDKISSNISRDERGLDAGLQDINYDDYTLLEQLKKCKEMLEKAERFELLVPLYNYLIIPIYEDEKNYEALSRCYSYLSKICNKIVEVTKTEKRLLGRFYKVAFVGAAYFGGENGQEYIYKEPKLTSLSEISERLKKLYADKFGVENVKLIMDSAPIKLSELDHNMAYIQVTHVVPYFENHELDLRLTDFERNHDISKFMYETPFTNEGKPRGNPEDQWKRKTILTTEYSFPYIKKRLVVIQRKTIEFSPIEVALDEMRQRIQELEDVVSRVPTDIKKLQLRLQGSIFVTVNAGPLIYASTFLDPARSPQYPNDKVKELKEVFREFVKICFVALQINRTLIKSDQHEYQKVLQKNYKKLCENLSSVLGESI